MITGHLVWCGRSVTGRNVVADCGYVVAVILVNALRASRHVMYAYTCYNHILLQIMSLGNWP